MKIYSVSRVTNYIKGVFDSDAYLGDIYIKGEISNLKLHSSGHIYLSLKDDEALIDAVMFRSSAEKLMFKPENGMLVIVGGYISVYPKSGSYQLYIREMQPSGKGELYLAYEQLKSELEKKGLFCAEHKKKIPRFPKCVAVITSAAGAAVRDIINVLSRRNNTVEIVLVPTLVQGEFSSEDIVSSLNTVQRWGKADVIILGRGGGSIEDLWSFNTLEVAKAIYDCTIPVISAVGHETDFTIADFVSDLRAPTPSAAAELAVMELSSINDAICQYYNRMSKATEFKLKNAESFNSVWLRIKNAYTSKKNSEKRLTDLYARINSAMNHRLSLGESRLSAINISVSGEKLLRLCEQHEAYALSVLSKIENNVDYRLNLASDKIKRLLGIIHSNSPTTILSKGYSLTFLDNKLLKSVEDVKVGDKVSVFLNNGRFSANITNIGSDGLDSEVEQ